MPPHQAGTQGRTVRDKRAGLDQRLDVHRASPASRRRHRSPAGRSDFRLVMIPKDWRTLARLVGHVGTSVNMEYSQKRRSKAAKCRNSHPVSRLPNAAPACLAQRSDTELPLWHTRRRANTDRVPKNYRPEADLLAPQPFRNTLATPGAPFRDDPVRNQSTRVITPCFT